MKFTQKILIFIGVAFTIGFLHAFLIHIGIWGVWRESLSQIPWFFYFLWIIITFYITLTLHELGHLVAFLIQGVKIRALYLTVFVFVKQKKWTFKIYKKLWILFGGLVVPDLPEIDSNETYTKTVEAFKRSLLTAPIVTISYLVIGFITLFLFPLLLSPSFYLGLWFLHVLYTIPLSLLYIYTFNLHNQSFYGDLVAVKKMNKDPYFTFAQINQYTLFSSVQSQSTEHYLYQKAVEMLKEVKDFKDLFIQHMLLTYLTGVALEGYSKDDVIDHKIRSSNFFFQRINEITYMVIHELILYHYRLKEVEIAYQIYERVKKIKGKLDPKLITYMLKKTAHQIHLEDHDAYLKEHQNVYIGDYWVFEPVIDPYAKMDDSHKVLPFILYQSEVDFEETESNE